MEHTEESGKACLYLVSGGQERGDSGTRKSYLIHPFFPLKVFEYLSTDLKKWMDKMGGKGPAFPLPLATVKVRQKVLNHSLRLFLIYPFLSFRTSCTRWSKAWLTVTSMEFCTVT